MNDLIKYNNLLCDEGMNSPGAEAILAAHAGDSDFERRARFVRFAIEARKRRGAHAEVRRKTTYLLLAILAITIGIFCFFKAMNYARTGQGLGTVEIRDR